MIEAQGGAAADPPDPFAREWPVVDFLLRLRADEESGVVRTLHEYLADYRDHEQEIAAEFLQARAADRTALAGAANPRRLGRFELERELGRGGEGTVFLAYEPLLARRVALKVLHSERHGDLDEARLVRAAAAAARLDHPNVCRVFGAGSEGQIRWVAMQYVEGESLAEVLRARALAAQPMAVREAARLLAGVARGLEHAHAEGVVHRDVKPGNIGVRRDGSAVLTDFGLAREVGSTADLTRTCELRGTPAYMAPECFETREIGPAVDLWSLGVILFECVTLANPFAATSPAAAARRIAEEPIWSHPAWRGFGDDLRAVLATALAKEPQRRYANAAVFAEDLERLACGQPVLARTPGTWTRFMAWMRREPRLALSLGVSASLLFVGTGVSSWAWRKENRAREVAEARSERVRGIARAILFEMDDALVDGTSTVEVRRTLVERAKDALIALRADAPDDRRLLRDLALAWSRLGDVSGHDSVANAGDRAAAARCYREAEACLAAIPGVQDAPDELRASLLMKRADVAGLDADETAKLFRTALAKLPPGTPDAARLRVYAGSRIAQIERDRGELGPALEAAERALSEAAGPLDRAFVVDTKATILAASGDPANALDELREAAEGLTKAFPDKPEPARVTHMRIMLGMHAGQCALMLGDPDAAFREFDLAEDRGRERMAADPADRAAVSRYVLVLDARGRALHALGRRIEGRQAWSEACTLAERHGLEEERRRLRTQLER